MRRALLFGCIARAAAPNLNGKYQVATTGDLDVPFNTDYESRGHEFFDVWAPEIATQYGQVFWKNQGSNPLPPHIVDRFKGKVIAFTGYEQDQVIVSPLGKPGENPELDASVPINWAYNHHYAFFVTGTGAQMEEVAAQPGDDHVDWAGGGKK